MNWLEISFHADEDNYELVSQIFIDAGSKGVLLEDSQAPYEIPKDRFGEIYRLNIDDYPKNGVVVKGYLAIVPQVEVVVDTIKTKLFDLAPKALTSFTVVTLAEEDWAHSWKEHYQPIHVTESLVIKPSWLEKSNRNDIVEILLDPGMAFGSGTHETTRLCLQLLEQYITIDSRVVDVGTGSGVLAIAAVKLGAESVYGVDLDEMAVIRARENATFNDCDVLLEKNNLMDGVNLLGWKPNLIVANIIAQVIVGMSSSVGEMFDEGDVFICSGIIDNEKDMVIDAFVGHGFEVVEVREENGWVAIVGKKS